MSAHVFVTMYIVVNIGAREFGRIFKCHLRLTSIWIFTMSFTRFGQIELPFYSSFG